LPSPAIDGAGPPAVDRVVDDRWAPPLIGSGPCALVTTVRCGWRVVVESYGVGALGAPFTSGATVLVAGVAAAF